MENTNNSDNKSVKYAVIPFDDEGTPECDYYWIICDSLSEALQEATEQLSQGWHLASVAEWDDDLCEVVNEEHTINLTKGIPTFD